MKGWCVWIGRISGICVRSVRGRCARVGGESLFLSMGLALLLTACVQANGSGGPARADLSLDLPPEPSLTVRPYTPMPVQTVPPPLGSGYTAPGQPASTVRHSQEYGIPARPGGSYGTAPATAGSYAKAPAYSGQKGNKPVKKKAVAKKKKKQKKKSAVNRANSAAGQAGACPCVPPQNKKKPSSAAKRAASAAE
ncbi:MAG: hypothetical protein H7835_04205 [Magnetococcus sp. XQGC-1]